MFVYDKLLHEFTQMTKLGHYTPRLRKAWDLLQHQAIHAVKAFEQDYVKGIVTDVQQHSVVLDVNYFNSSTCTCEDGLFCSHMAALFFAYSTSLTNGKVLTQQAYFQLLGVVNASEKVSASPAQDQHKELTPFNIFSIYDSTCSDDWKRCKHSFHPLSQSLTTLKGLAKDKPYELQRYYWSTAILYVISLGERAVQAVDSFNRYYYEMSFKRLIEPWISQLQDIMTDIEVQKEWTKEEQNWIHAIFKFTVEQIEKYTKSTFEWDYFSYRLVRLLYQFEAYQTSIDEQIKRLLTNGQPPAVQSVAHGMKAMLHITQQQDSLAIENIQKAYFDKVQRIIYPVVERRMAMQNWDAVTLWMNFLADHFANSGQMKSVGPFLNLCQKAAQLQQGEKKWSNYLIRYLPHSYNILSESLLKLQEYKSWANLQIYMGRKPEDFKGIELQQIEKASPAVLLPMYHQAIDQLVESRNRQSYRMAVKHLKKLKTIYVELSREASWNSYIDQLQTKFARLRAFQEELLKGKVL